MESVGDFQKVQDPDLSFLERDIAPWVKENMTIEAREAVRKEYERKRHLVRNFT